MFIKKKILVTFLASFALLGSAGAAQARTLTSPEASLLQTMNAVRTSHGLAPLRVDVHLLRAARAHSRLGRHLSTYGGSEAEDIPRALEHFRAAEAVLAKGPKEAALGFVYVGLANALMRALRVQESLNASLNALDIAEATGNQLLGGFAMLIRGWALAEAAALAAGTALVERAWHSWRRGHYRNCISGNRAGWFDLPIFPAQA